jgi:hypothetical protein
VLNLFSNQLSPMMFVGKIEVRISTMFRLTFALLLAFLVSSTVFAQGKGVDKSNERVRDQGSRAPASNGSKQDVGSGRGFDFGRDQTPPQPRLDNPFRLTGRRDAIITAIQDVMRDQKMVVDEAASKLSEGIVVSQPYTFTKGVVISEPELSRYADLPTSSSRGWTRGRYTLTVEVQPIDGTAANVSVNAKIEGRTDGATGAEWITVRSTGLAEDEFLEKLITAVTGATPPGRIPREP